MHRPGSTFLGNIAAIFLSIHFDYARIQQPIRNLKQVGGGLTILMTGSYTPSDAAHFSADKVFFIQPQKGSDSADLRNAVSSAIQLSPESDSFFIFENLVNDTFSRNELKKIAGKRADFYRSGLGGLYMSRRYASHVVETGRIPSVGDAIENGFSAPMSVREMVRSPKDAIRQYSTIIKFMLVGATGVGVNLLVLTILKIFTGAITANAIAVELSIMNNFVWNDRFTFKSMSHSEHYLIRLRLYRFVKYNFVSLFSLAVNEAVFYISYTHGIYYITSSLLAIATAFVINYFGSSRWAWGGSLSRSVKD